jgi:hypothetical protein
VIKYQRFHSPSTPLDPEAQASIDHFVRYLLCDKPGVRDGMGAILREKAIPAVMNVVLSAVIAKARSKRASIRDPAIRALEAVRPLGIERLKRELLRTRGRKTRQKLVELLGKICPIHDRQVTMLLAQILHNDHEDVSVRLAAREAIRRVDPEFEQYAGFARARA